MESFARLTVDFSTQSLFRRTVAHFGNYNHVNESLTSTLSYASVWFRYT